MTFDFRLLDLLLIYNRKHDQRCITTSSIHYNVTTRNQRCIITSKSLKDVL